MNQEPTLPNYKVQSKHTQLQHPNYQHRLDYPEDIQATDDQTTNYANQQLPVPPAHDDSPQEPPNQDIVMQPVPCDDTTETHMHSEANGQRKPQAPQPATDMGPGSSDPQPTVAALPATAARPKLAAKLNHRRHHLLLAWGGVQ